MEAGDVRSGAQSVAQPNSDEIDGDGYGFWLQLFELPMAVFQLIFDGKDDREVMVGF